MIWQLCVFITRMKSGQKRLIDNWMNNGQALGQYKLTALLEALGFLDAQVKEQAKLGRIENYMVTIPAVVGKKSKL